MNKQLSPKCVGSYLVRKRQTIKQFKNEAEKLEKMLISSAPENLREWLKEDIIASNLVEFGKASRKINFNNDDYGFNGEKDIRQKIQELSKNWNGVISIKVKKYEPHRIEIKFYVVFK